MHILEYVHMKGYEYNISLEVMFQALSSPVRIEIVRLLAAGPCCVKNIAEHLGLSQTVVSQNLRVLRLAGMVEAEKCGTFTHYSIRREAIDVLRQFLSAWCHYNCHNNK